jgi:threonine dehydrogenase-like Zn-dependent dehydrogenase
MISPRFVGLCGTDIQIYRRARNGTANILGHEGVGVIAEVGDSVHSWSRGDAVVFSPVNPMNQDEVLGGSFDGLLQEQFLVENAESMDWLIHRVPFDLLAPVGALVEPVATAIYSHELAVASGSKRKAVVIGDGPIAMVNSIVLGLSGFDSVLMVHGRSTRKRWIAENGYFERGDVVPGRAGVVESVLDRLGGTLADVALICTPGEAVGRRRWMHLNISNPAG